MYHIKLTINGTALDMSYAGGYLIRTITGLTGASARITTAQHSSGYGEAFVGATVAGLPIRVEGYVLDSDTTAGTLIKTRLINDIVAGGTGTLEIYNGDTVHRVTEVVVSAAPTVTQEKHARFSFQLYSPRGIWHTSNAATISLDGASIADPVEKLVDGQMPAEYTFRAIAAMDAFGLSLCCDDMYLYLNFQLLAAGKLAAGSTLLVYRDNGRLRITIDGADAMKALDPRTNLWYLPVGRHNFSVLATGVAATLTYKPSYAGVILGGV